MNHIKNEEIPNGQAVISGNFTPNEAKLLVGRLNSGALPVPISLLSTQTIGATLGEKAINAGVKAALYGFLLVALFLVLWYRLPGLLAVVSLFMFVVAILALFKPYKTLDLSKTKRIDKNRENYLQKINSNSLPPTVSTNNQAPVQFEDGRVIIGRGLFNG
jgi:hypothetical protein